MTTTKTPLEASLSGKNAYYLGTCRHTEHNPAYCACLDKIRRIDAGERLGPDLARCADAIRLSTCQAKNMRQAEELAGEALYFIPRESLNTSHNRVPPWSVEGAGTRPVKRAPPTPAPIIVAAGTYADAINAAMKEQPPAGLVSAVAKTPEQLLPRIEEARAAKPPIEPGETPIQYARRVAALRNQPGEHK
jgi:hypothetical protein